MAGKSILNSMDEKIKLGISKCLLGEKVRYNGQHKLDRFLRDEVSAFVDWFPLCPEVECGFSIPREAMDLVGESSNPQLITVNTKSNLTVQMQMWIEEKLIELEKCDFSGFVFKIKSPSCALDDAKLFTYDGTFNRKVSGLFAGAFMEKFPLTPVINEKDIHNTILRNNFFQRVFVYSRWQKALKKNHKI